MEKITVIYGGQSSERDISLASGQAIFEALQRLGYEALLIDFNDIVEHIDTIQSSIMVFNALHGSGGEDGQLQGFLSTLGVDYTGCGIEFSAVTMNKTMTKLLWSLYGVPTPKFALLNDVLTSLQQDISQSSQQTAEKVVKALKEKGLSLPLIIKPNADGSSVGLKKIDTEPDLLTYLEEFLTNQSTIDGEKAVNFHDSHGQYGPNLMIEACIIGEEYTVGFVGDHFLPPIKIIPKSGLYDYEAKYKRQDTVFECPTDLTEDEIESLNEVCRQAVKAIGHAPWGRLDMIFDQLGQPWFIEINSVPGMTERSLVPRAAAAAGMSFDQLIESIIQASSSHREIVD